jgi:hypothetical protein
MRLGRAMGCAGAIALSALAMRCAAFGTSAHEGADAEGGGDAITDAPSAMTDAASTRDGSLTNLPEGAVVWPGNGHGYLFVHAPGIQWATADTAARALKAHLVTVTTKEENDFVFTLLQKDVDASYVPDTENCPIWFGPWLGATRLSDSADRRYGWTWVTGEAFTYVNWADVVGEPSGLPDGGESRIIYYAYDTNPCLPSSTTWGDHAPDGVTSGYVVEFE